MTCVLLILFSIVISCLEITDSCRVYLLLSLFKHFLSLSVGDIWIRLLHGRIVLLISMILPMRWPSVVSLPILTMHPRNIWTFLKAWNSLSIRIHICIFKSLSVIVLLVGACRSIYPRDSSGAIFSISISLCFRSKVPSDLLRLVHSHLVVCNSVLVRLNSWVHSIDFTLEILNIPLFPLFVVLQIDSFLLDLGKSVSKLPVLVLHLFKTQFTHSRLLSL